MKIEPRHLAYVIELQPGEKLTLPASLIEGVGPGRWVLTVQPADSAGMPVRGHEAFLKSYSEQDEGLYDDCARG